MAGICTPLYQDYFTNMPCLICLVCLVLPYAEIKESRVLREGDIGNVITCQNSESQFHYWSFLHFKRKMGPNSDLKCQSYFKNIYIYFNSSNPKNNPNIPRILAQIPVSQYQPLKPKILGQIPRNGIAGWDRVGELSPQPYSSLMPPV